MAREQTLQDRIIAILNITNLAEAYRQDLLKLLVQSYEERLTVIEEIALAKTSLYKQWWDYMQAAFEFLEVDEQLMRDPDFQRIRHEFGDPSLSFDEWWPQYGRRLFMLDGELPLIQLIDLDRDFAPDSHPKWITIRIPLTIPMNGIIEQLKKILKVCYPGNKLNPLAFAQTIVKILPKERYQEDMYKKYLKVWKERQHDLCDPQRPPREWWQIARDLKLNERLLPDPQIPPDSLARTELEKLAKRYFEAGVQLMQGAIRGEFPRYGVDD